ncbi:hypothetical protein B0H12DRAFT_1255989 [Mycena haematopus]|nr:hypothetical protein B0H12DRAFT_1255989 [Mycena haematopus]
MYPHVARRCVTLRLHVLEQNLVSRSLHFCAALYWVIHMLYGPSSSHQLSVHNGKGKKERKIQRCVAVNGRQPHFGCLSFVPPPTTSHVYVLLIEEHLCRVTPGARRPWPRPAATRAPFFSLRSGTWRLKALRARAEKGRCPRQPSIIDRGSKFSSVSTLAPRANNDVNNGKPFLQGPYCKGCVKHQQKLLQDTVEALEEAEEDVRPNDGARKMGMYSKCAPYTHN